jgi:hypothetical protein
VPAAASLGACPCASPARACCQFWYSPCEGSDSSGEPSGSDSLSLVCTGTSSSTASLVMPYCARGLLGASTCGWRWRWQGVPRPAAAAAAPNPKHAARCSGQ